MNIEKPEKSGEKEVPESPLKRDENCLILIRKRMRERSTRRMLIRLSPKEKIMMMLITRAAKGRTERASFSGDITLFEMINGRNSLTISNKQIINWAKISSDMQI